KPEQFAAVASLSGALDLEERVRASSHASGPLSAEECIGIFGPNPALAGGDSDLFALAQNIAAKPGMRPEIYLACGSEDELLGDNRRFHHHLDSLHFEHRYVEERGAHEWGFWDTQI